MKHLDLFSGIGGFSLAARWAGIETVAFCERDEFCQKVLKKHWPDINCFTDIKTLTADVIGNRVDLITAGFPCQPFSVAGSKKGKDDDRYLWPDTMRIIKECKPTWCILENVSGIIPMLDPILEDLENEGYNWQAFLIPASAAGAPHKRERIWIVAHANSQQCNERKANNETIAERSKWSQSAAKIGDVISDTACIADAQTDSSVSPIGSEWGTRDTNTCEHWANESIFNWEKDQPPIPGVDDGLSNGVDRNKSLGNSIVPQIPYLFMRMIKEIGVTAL